MKPRRRLEPYLHLYTLCALTVAHPLLDLLARYPEIFTVRGWSAGAAWLLAGALVFALPLAPVALWAVLARRSEALAAAFQTAAVVLAAMVWLLQLSHTWKAERLALAFALAGSGLAGWLYRRFSGARSFLTFLSPALLAVPLVFLLNPRVAGLGREAPLEIPGLEVAAEAPIVFVVFDALSMTALVDDQQLINPRSYPHLAALAADATWFPNASSVARWTLEAVPAILTGDYPDPGKLPRFADHPRNLFTLLGDSYRVVAAEAATDLCPPRLNAYPRPEPPTGLPALASDLGLIWLHRTLPASAAGRLPRVDQAWGSFIDTRARVSGEIGRFYEFLDTFEAEGPPTLYFLHVVFPHMPYQYLPSGKMFRDQVPKFLKPATGGRQRSPDDETRVFLYKRYLMQTGLVDRMVGDLTRRLRELGLYDRSYVVLTADHGGRMAAIGHPDDVFFVPLLVKQPRPAAGAVPQVDRRPVSTLDVLPSLLDLLGVPPLASGGRTGRSFFGADYQPPSELYESGQRRLLDLGLHQSKLDLVSWKLDRFGTGDDPLALYRAGSTRPELLGERLEDLSVGEEAPGLRVELDLGGPEIIYNPDSKLAPALISGSLRLEGYDGPCCELAVTVNGRVEATMNARPHQVPDWFRFRCTIAESVLRPGPNDVRIWLLRPGDPRYLVALRHASAL